VLFSGSNRNMNPSVLSYKSHYDPLHSYIPNLPGKMAESAGYEQPMELPQL